MAQLQHSHCVQEAFSHISASATLSQLHDTVAALRTGLGLGHIAYHLVEAPGYDASEQPLVILTYPERWIIRYLSQGYQKIDPVVSEGLQGIMPKDWSSLSVSTPDVSDFFEEAADYGVGRQGLTMTIRGPNRDVALFTFTANVDHGEWKKMKAVTIPSMLLVGHAFHDRVRQIKMPELQVIPKLSPRELQCLALCAQGLRDNQTAQKLHIKEAVVRAYLDSARHKLTAPTRPHAVATALKLGLITSL